MKKINVSFFTFSSFVSVFRSLPLLCFELFLSLLCVFFFNFTLHSCLSHSHLPLSSSPCGLHLLSSHLFLFVVSSLVSFLQPSLLPPFSFYFMFLLSSVPDQIFLQRCLSCSSPHQLLLWWLGGGQTASGDICGARQT